MSKLTKNNAIYMRNTISTKRFDIDFRTILKEKSSDLDLILGVISKEFDINNYQTFKIECEGYLEAFYLNSEIEKSCQLQQEQELDLEPINLFEFFNEFETVANYFNYSLYDEDVLDMSFRIDIDKDSFDSEYPLFDNLKLILENKGNEYIFSSLKKETVLKEISELNKEHFALKEVISC
ncbi:hypothetical protein [Vagococcus fluvialis]|uniref:hypothetical protein n=1 Tax=Vagococcus fluvialis TaxID=2738 RepID=UPI001D0A726E|nr:hypothetical protein [Vagococcus fluvialis]UDM84096.1 hypothetical protein K5K96_15235 [Vagococcus fluvialis]